MSLVYCGRRFGLAAPARDSIGRIVCQTTGIKLRISLAFSRCSWLVFYLASFTIQSDVYYRLFSAELLCIQDATTRNASLHYNVMLNLAVACSSFSGSAGKFLGSLAGSSRKIRLMSPNVSSVSVKIIILHSLPFPEVRISCKAPVRIKQTRLSADNA